MKNIQDKGVTKKLKKFNKKFFITTILFIILSFIVVINCGCGRNTGQTFLNQETNKNLAVHYIDVGQGDAELICFPDGEVMLIDTGTNESSSDLVNYIKKCNIEKIDYMILTHPHEDHIGGANKVLESFTVTNVYMPRISDDMIPSTVTYEKTLKSLIDKKINVKEGKAGIILKQSSDLNVEILAPNKESYNDLNDYSIVIKLEYMNKSFMFMGDAQYESEMEILDNFDIKSDVLKCGHHGSRTSGCKKFLSKMNPKYAIISCGKNNKYGHPHKQFIERLKKENTLIYRTDLDGSIIVKIEDGDIKINTMKKQSTE